jgi:hypothetical protein
MKRPLTVTIIACLLVAVGVVGSAYHLNELKQNAFRGANIWIFVLEFVAILCGVFLFRGASWARWLAMAWIAFHVVVSFFDSFGKVAVHAVILVLFAYFLFQRNANSYFRDRQSTHV